MCNKMSNKVLIILARFVIQTEQIIFRDKPRLSRNDCKNQGWLSNRVLAVKAYAVL